MTVFMLNFQERKTAPPPSEQEQEEKPVNPDTKVLIKDTGEVGYFVKEDGDFYYLRIPQTDWPFPVYAYVNKKRVKRFKVSNEPTDIEEAPF